MNKKITNEMITKIWIELIPIVCPELQITDVPLKIKWEDDFNEIALGRYTFGSYITLYPSRILRVAVYLNVPVEDAIRFTIYHELYHHYQFTYNPTIFDGDTFLPWHERRSEIQADDYAKEKLNKPSGKKLHLRYRKTIIIKEAAKSAALGIAVGLALRFIIKKLTKK